jgi:hypothetical protein
MWKNCFDQRTGFRVKPGMTAKAGLAAFSSACDKDFRGSPLPDPAQHAAGDVPGRLVCLIATIETPGKADKPLFSFRLYAGQRYHSRRLLPIEGNPDEFKFMARFDPDSSCLVVGGHGFCARERNE